LKGEKQGEKKEGVPFGTHFSLHPAAQLSAGRDLSVRRRATKLAGSHDLQPALFVRPQNRE